MLHAPRVRAFIAPCVIGVALACGAFAPAAAQSAAPAPSPTPTTAPEIGRVSTGDRQDEPLDASARITYVVTKADMIRHGYTDVAAAIAGLPGVTISRYGAAGSEANVTLRGANANGVLVLLDGRPIAGAQIGDIDLGAIPTTGIERIEVVEGSGSTLYGSGASSGVINIITAGAHTPHGTPFASLAAGSFADQRFDFETPNVAFSREVAANDFGYAAFPGVPAGVRANADLGVTTARVSDAGTIGAVNLSGTIGMVSRDLGVPGATDFLTDFARQNDDSQNVRLSAALARAQATTTLDLSGDRQTIEYADPSVAEGGPELDYSTDANVAASLRNVVVSDGARVIYGVDLMHGVARNDGGYGVFSVTPFAQTAIFAQDSLRLGASSRVYAGLRAEQDGGAGGAVTPSLGGIVALGTAVSLRLNAGTAFRVPTAEDLTYPGFSNPLLKPEHTQSFDATVDDEHLFGGVSVGWFVQTGTDLIVLNPNVNYALPFAPGNEPLINEQQSSIGGLTFDLATQPFAGIVARFNVTDLYRALGYDAGVAAQRLDGRPVLATNLDLGYTGRASGTLAAAGVVVHDEGARDFSGLANAFTRVDAYARFRLAHNALLSVRAFNLGNEQYQEIGTYPMPGRSFAVEVSTR